MSSIPYNYGKYIDDKVSMTDQGHVDSAKQISSPASAGSRGLSKTMQFTNNPTQMKMGNTTMAESIIEIRNILNRIDGVNVPVQEDDGDERAIAAMKLAKDENRKEGFDYPQGGKYGYKAERGSGTGAMGTMQVNVTLHNKETDEIMDIKDMHYLELEKGEGQETLAMIWDENKDLIKKEDDTSSKGMNKYGLAAVNKDGKFYSYRNGKLTGTFDNMADLQKHQHDLIKNEDLGQMAHKVEQDHEVQMARSDLYKAAKYSIKLHERLKNISEEEGLEGWVAAKITKASDYLSSVFHYMDYEMMSSEEMTESRTKIVQAIKAKSEQPQPTYKETINKKYQAKLEEMSKKPVLEDFVGKPISEEEFDRLAEKQDACYHKVKARYKVWPSAYASGALVQCRKKGAKNWGNKSKK